jgi:hypothetical protein
MQRRSGNAARKNAVERMPDYGVAWRVRYFNAIPPE